MADTLNKDALLDEITRRVIQLDSQRQFDEDLHKTVSAYIEALDEITSVGKSDIEAIAQQVINEHRQLRAAPGFIFTLKHGLIVGAVLLAVLLFMAIYTGKYFGLKEALSNGSSDTPASQINNRAQIIRAKLSEVFVVLSPLKTAALEHYQTTLKFPSNFAEIGYQQADFIDGKLIRAIVFTAEGGILVSLGASFDDNTKLLLQSDALKNNAVFKWQCKTTLPQHYLGPTSAAPCEYAQDL